MFTKVLQVIRPIARSIKYGRLLRRAEQDAQQKNVPSLQKPVSFIFGCGRSGTTILGKLLAAHPKVCYLFEPYHTWRAILPASDMIQLYGESAHGTHCILGKDSISETQIQRFNACMQRELSRSGNTSLSLIEKTPINVMRIPMLKALSPTSPMLHLVRNGIDVVRSIDRLASTNTYQMSGKGEWNQWWGRDHCKWKALSSDSITKGYFSDEIEQLTTNQEKGALEWLVSLKEINANRERIEDQLIEVTYKDLTSKSEAVLARICAHFTIDLDGDWLQESCSALDEARKNEGDTLLLPPKMCSAFNEFQDQYGFEGHAVEK